MVQRLEGLNLHLRMPMQEGSASGLQHQEPHLNPEVSVVRSATSLASWLLSWEAQGQQGCLHLLSWFLRGAGDGSCGAPHSVGSHQLRA